MRVAMGLQYDGQGFSGWQEQPQVKSVQTYIELALRKFSGVATDIKITVAGRTDAGVHALGQVIHFDTEISRKPFSWLRGTNAFLPKSIKVQWVQFVDNDFHARFSAQQRCYFYALYTGTYLPPLLFGKAGYQMLTNGSKLDIMTMRKAASILCGSHDFSAFQAAKCQAKSSVKTIYELHLEANDQWVFLRIKANAFLYHMVRNILGSLIAIGLGRRPAKWMEEILHKQDRSLAAPTFMPDGLYLAEVSYPDKFNLPGPNLNASLFHNIFRTALN